MLSLQIVSAIFYAANGQYKIAYIDCLFCCVSAMTSVPVALNSSRSSS